MIRLFLHTRIASTLSISSITFDSISRRVEIPFTHCDTSPLIAVIPGLSTNYYSYRSRRPDPLSDTLKLLATTYSRRSSAKQSLLLIFFRPQEAPSDPSQESATRSRLFEILATTVHIPPSPGIAMRIRHALRVFSTPFVASIEDSMVKSGKWTRAQRFRRMQHHLFGFSQEDLRLLCVYIATWNLLGDLVQKDRHLVEEYQRLGVILREKVNAETYSEEAVAEDLRAFDAMNAERLENIDICKSGFKRIDMLSMKLGHLAIFRALESFHSRPSWHMLPALRLLCAQSGGCCGRDCGHCETRSTSGSFKTCLEGHCSDACHCCREHWGNKKPVQLVDSPHQLLFCDNVDHGDAFAEWFMDSYVWGMSGTKGFRGVS
ncbi:hypothetical protein BJX70DRAFT_367891 [Aspergillus crustosus]